MLDFGLSSVCGQCVYAVGMAVELLSTTRAAERLGYNPARFRLLVRTGRGPTPVVRGAPGRAGFYAVEELDRWAATHRKWEKFPPSTPAAE